MSDDQAPSTENGGGGDVEIVEKSEDQKKLVDFGLDTTVADELEKLFQAKLVTYDDLDPRALEAIRDFPIECAIAVLKQLLADSNLQHVNNKSAYICGVMKTYRQKQSLGEDKPAVTNGPDEKKLKEILDRTGYALEITTGQRKYGGPPPGWDGGAPGNGHECFVGRIPKTVYEDDLIPVFEKFGTIWDLRLMMNPMQGCNRGYAFVTFTTAEAAREAAKQLNNYEIKPNKKLQVNVSIANVRLFVGNIPKNKSREDILEEFKKLTEGLREVIVYAFPDDPKKKNRGFAFLEYDTHKSASGAKRKLASGRIRVWGSEIIVDWADPQDEPDEETMAKVKVLYVRNLRSNVTEEELKKIFEPFGEIERVKKVKDYGFVHYKERDSTLSALEAMNGYKLHEVEINVTLAKPANENKARERRMRRERDTSGNVGYDDYYSSYPPASFGPPPPMMRGRIARGGMRGRGGMMRPPAPMDYYDDYSGYGQGYGYDDYSSYGGCYEDFSAEYSHLGTPQTAHRGRGRGGHHAPAPHGPVTQQQPGPRGTHRGRVAMGQRGGGNRGANRGANRGGGGGFVGPPAYGGRGGRGHLQSGMRGMAAPKRKGAPNMGGGLGGPASKRRPPPPVQVVDGHFEAQPIAQQPLAVQQPQQQATDESWYQDSYDQHEWN